MSLIGIDVGTTGVKAAAFDESGKLLSTAYEEYPLLFPFPGACELDSRGVINAALRVIEAVACQVKTNDPVAAIGIASQGEAFTAVTSAGEIIGNAMPISDTRSAPLVREWVDEYGMERLYRITGHTAYPMYSLFKLDWVKRNAPEVWRTAWKFLFFSDLLAFVLTGQTKTDCTLAARTMFFDVGRRDWSSEILDRLGLSRERLPDVGPSGEVTGCVSAEVGPRLGLGSRVAVAVAGHDQPVGALGCGAAASGMASYSVGTAECICPAVDRFILSPALMDANLASYQHVLPGLYTTVAFSLNGGSVLKWVRDSFATDETRAARELGEDPYDRIISASSDEPSDLILIPHYGPTGTPHFNPHGTGMLFGLTLSTSRAQILRAFLEGITYEMKWNVAILAGAGFNLAELRAVGGGAKSDAWMQIKADILGVPLTTMQVTEATCMGAAILAGWGVGALDLREASSRWAAPIRTFDPHKANVKLYEDRFAIYKELYGALGGSRDLLNDMKLRENDA